MNIGLFSISEEISMLFIINNVLENLAYWLLGFEIDLYN